MATLRAIQKVLYSWVKDAVGSGVTVLWGNQAITVPPGNHVVLQFTTTPHNLVTQKSKIKPLIGSTANKEIVKTLQKFDVSISAYRLINKRGTGEETTITSNDIINSITDKVGATNNYNELSQPQVDTITIDTLTPSVVYEFKINDYVISVNSGVGATYDSLRDAIIAEIASVLPFDINIEKDIINNDELDLSNYETLFLETSDTKLSITQSSEHVEIGISTQGQINDISGMTANDEWDISQVDISFFTGRTVMQSYDDLTDISPDYIEV